MVTADEFRTVWLIFATSFGVGFSGAVAPGPLLVFTIREAARAGPFAGLIVSAGHATLELVLVLALVWGVSRFLTADPVVAVVSLAGGGLLLWMGWGLVRRPAAHLPQPERGLSPRRGFFGTYAGGAFVTVSNPFFVVWWATIGLSYLVWAREIGAAGVGAFYVGHILSDFTWFGGVAVAVASGSRLMGPRLYRWLLAGCGLFLLALGIVFLVSGAQRAAGI